MRYIIDRKTNEHERYDGQNYDATKYRIVEADSEGWIPRTGSENPLPDDVWCEIKCSDNSQSKSPLMAKSWRWNDPGLKFYRPILAEKVQEPEPTKPKRLFDDLLERLEASHAAAQALPDLVEQLRDRLKPMGLSVMYLSEFDAVEPEPAVEPDMSDWRNWREGDVLECINGDGHMSLASGNLVAVRQVQFTNGTIMFCHPDDFEGVALTRRFRFHSRPAKGE